MPRSNLVASYRLQLTPSFGFDEALRLLDPIRRLGVSHLYLSPVAQAVPESEHGYNVVDPRVVRAEFGGDAGLERLLDGAEAAGLGVIVDHVPNHVSVERADLNPFWWAALRGGPGSDAARWFDIDWDAANGKVIIPKLGEPLVDLLAAGLIESGEGSLGPEVRYGPLRFPITPGTEHLPLAELLAVQHYELSWWRNPARNVRRFFTIDDLVAVRVEDDAVRSVIDSLPARLCAHPAFDGVRVDHVDGLAKPGHYLQQLRDTIGDRWLLVEKILGPGEQLPASWPVDGTTGYEHITATEHLMLDDAALPAFDKFWTVLVESGGSEDEPDFHVLEDTARREVLSGGLLPDMDRLLRTAKAEGDPAPATDKLRAAVVELTVSLDRYRTYLPGDEPSVGVLESAAAKATAARPDLAEPIAWFVALINRSAEVRTRWEQLTGPAMAKGAEDRAFYRHYRLASLCEVGGQPGRWSIGLDAFHDRQSAVQAERPLTMLAGSTHDTKRSGGVRARSLALATRPDAFVAAAQTWIDANRDLTDRLRPTDVTLAIQTALTSQPIGRPRLSAYLVKAAREAELGTNWVSPDERYEGALNELAERLVASMADRSTNRPAPLAVLSEELTAPGAVIGLRLAALQLMSPGVPDLYQGSPFELLSLVDPDNRRPPDWARWEAIVGQSMPMPKPGPGSLAELIAAGSVDEARTALVQDLLALRTRRAAAFGPTAGYERVAVEGPGSDSVVAFRRFDASGQTNDAVTVIVQRPTVTPANLASTTVDLGGQRWRSVVGGNGSNTANPQTGSAPAETVLGALDLAVFETVR